MVLAAPVTTNGSVLHVLSPEDCDIDILENGRTIDDFIDIKIKELSTEVSSEVLVKILRIHETKC